MTAWCITRWLHTMRGTMLLDSGPMNYHVNTFGVFLNYKL